MTVQRGAILHSILNGNTLPMQRWSIHFQGMMGKHSGEHLGQAAQWNWYLYAKLTSCNTASTLSKTSWPNEQSFPVT